LRQEITLDNVFVLLIVCNPTNNFDGNGNGSPLISYVSVAELLYILISVHIFRNKLGTKVGGCL
jgi:hypothetical protein